MSSIANFKLKPADFKFVGDGLSRPECILAERDGTLWVSDDKSALMRIDRAGKQARLGNVGGMPNGLAIDKSGAILIANIGDGKLYRLTRDGKHEMILDQFEGKPLGSLNFVYIDARDRIWLTISTLTVPRIQAVQQPIPDGYILMHDGKRWRKMGAGYCFTNEVRFDADGRHIYIAETAIGRVSRHALAADGAFGPRETYGPETLFPGAKIDGITFDAEGNLWVTEVGRNSIIVITPEQSSYLVFCDPSGQTLKRPASLTFAGPDMKTAYIGSLDMDRIPYFRSPTAGRALEHWER